MQNSHTITDAKERATIIDKAEKSYSSLRAQGLTGFRCRVVPDFDAMFKTLTADEVGKTQILPMLKKIRFQVVAGPDGGAAVSHSNDEIPPTQDVAVRVNQLTGGVDKMIDGFLRTWTNMAISSPFTGDNTAIKIEDFDAFYRLSQKNDSFDVTLLVRRDFTIEKMDVYLSGQHAVLYPTWDATPKGWRLAGYEGTYGEESGSKTPLSVKFAYQDVEGFQLLHSVDVTMSLPSGTVDGTFHVPFVFTDYQVTKK
jgi:hypothetical protein